jgi:molybdenum-dependent DNA-binding transcriptional regulator ModE
MEEVVAFLRRVESFGTVSFAARRLHLSRAAFFDRLSSIELKAGGKLVAGGDALVLTNRARRLLTAFSATDEKSSTQVSEGCRSCRKLGHRSPRR